MDRGKTVGAGAFKQGCLAILDQVAEDGVEYTITKRNRPVARVVPVEDRAEHEATILASLRGRGRMLVSAEELIAPVAGAGWPDIALEP